MPTINNETVIGSGYVTYRNARPQLLSNGWIVAAVYSSSTTALLFRVKKTSAGAWENLAFLTKPNVLSWSLQVKGTRVFSTLRTSSSNATSFLNFDATTVSSSTTLSASVIDNTSTSGAFSGEDLIINSDGTELHHIFSAKTATYSAGFMPRYMKGVIAVDGTVSWGAVEQVVTIDLSYNLINPALYLNSNNIPCFVVESDGLRRISGTDFSQNTYFKAIFNFFRIAQTVYGGNYGSTPRINAQWSYEQVHEESSTSGYLQVAPRPVFVPQSINGLAKGRIFVSWHGKDTTDTAKFNVSTSFSDTDGVTWSARVKQTSGNTYDQMNASLTADSQGKVLLTWDSQNATTTQTALKVFNGTWGATTTLTGDGYTNVSTLFDNTFKLGMTTPPLIRQSTSGVYFSGAYNQIPSISPASGALGDKTASSVLSYTVAPESGSTITSIVEKVNGTTVNTYSNPASLSRTFTIPQSTWDALKYYNTHTISVTVTDSNGMANTQVYSFNKALANDASLLEGAKAAKDGKDRISTKRDGIAGQVGLPAGSTFDAISAQLDAGVAVVKRQSGTITSSASVINSLYFVTIPISAIGFIPKSIDIAVSSDGTPLASVNTDATFNVTNSKIMQAGDSNKTLDGTTWYINSTSVRLPVGASYGNTAVKWIAYG